MKRKSKLRGRRSDFQKITKEARILKFMRQSRGLSMRRAAKIVGVSEATINHLDIGRMDVHEKWIFKLLGSYGYNYEDYLDYLDKRKRLPEDTLKDCVNLLQQLSPEKLRAVYGILLSF
jgi:transcriptional regulator with XRE-family HTH domain